MLGCLVWCGETLSHQSAVTESLCLWLNLLSPKAPFGVLAEDRIISLTLRDIAGVCDKPEGSAFAMLFETRIAQRI